MVRNELQALRNCHFPLYLYVSTFSQFEEGDVNSLGEFTPSQTVEASVLCLQLINPEFQSSKLLPDAMSARYRMCTNLANTVQVRLVVDCNTLAVHIQSH